MIRSNLYDYGDAYILVKGTKTVPNTAATGAIVKNTNKNVIFKNCALFTDCITEINITQVDDAQKRDIVMSMYNLIEYSYAYSKTSGSWDRDEANIDASDNYIDFLVHNSNSISLKKIRWQIGNSDTKDVETMVSLAHLKNKQ